MLVNEPDKLGKVLLEEAVHRVLGIGHELRQRPERPLLVRQVHEQQRGHRGHALAVAHLRVVDGVGGQHVVELDLALAVAAHNQVTHQ